MQSSPIEVIVHVSSNLKENKETIFLNRIRNNYKLKNFLDLFVDKKILLPLTIFDIDNLPSFNINNLPKIDTINTENNLKSKKIFWDIEAQIYHEE